MEEIGGDPLQITVNTVSVTRIYGSVSEFSTPSLLSRENHPAVHLRCQKGKHITDIEFASYGNPVEDCRESGRSCHGSCHAEMSEFVVKNVKFYCLTSYMLMPHCIKVQYYQGAAKKHKSLTTEIPVLFFQACLGRRKCAVPVRAAKFGADPCPGMAKSLSVVAICG